MENNDGHDSDIRHTSTIALIGPKYYRETSIDYVDRTALLQIPDRIDFFVDHPEAGQITSEMDKEQIVLLKSERKARQLNEDVPKKIVFLNHVPGKTEDAERQYPEAVAHYRNEKFDDHNNYYADSSKRKEGETEQMRSGRKSLTEAAFKANILQSQGQDQDPVKKINFFDDPPEPPTGKLNFFGGGSKSKSKSPAKLNFLADHKQVPGSHMPQGPGKTMKHKPEYENFDGRRKSRNSLTEAAVMSQMQSNQINNKDNIVFDYSSKPPPYQTSDSSDHGTRIKKSQKQTKKKPEKIPRRNTQRSRIPKGDNEEINLEYISEQSPESVRIIRGKRPDKKAKYKRQKTPEYQARVEKVNRKSLDEAAFKAQIQQKQQQQDPQPGKVKFFDDSGTKYDTELLPNLNTKVQYKKEGSEHEYETDHTRATRRSLTEAAIKASMQYESDKLNLFPAKLKQPNHPNKEAKSQKEPKHVEEVLDNSSEEEKELNIQAKNKMTKGHEKPSKEARLQALRNEYAFYDDHISVSQADFARAHGKMEHVNQETEMQMVKKYGEEDPDGLISPSVKSTAVSPVSTENPSRANLSPNVSPEVSDFARFSKPNPKHYTEVDLSTLKITNINDRLGYKGLYNLFPEAISIGMVSSQVECGTNQQAKRSAFVIFDSVTDARCAMRRLNGKIVCGVKLMLDFRRYSM